MQSHTFNVDLYTYPIPSSVLISTHIPSRTLADLPSCFQTPSQFSVTLLQYRKLSESLVRRVETRPYITICVLPADARCVSHCIIDLLVQGRIQGGGGGMGGPCPPPLFGTEPARNAEVYHALSARSYFDAVHISI